MSRNRTITENSLPMTPSRWAYISKQKIHKPQTKGKQFCGPRWLSWMRRPTGDQEVAGSIPAEVGNILSWRLIMKYFLRSFSPFCWFKKGSCQFLAKECAQYWLVNVWLGKLTALDMTPLGWLGRKTSTQTNNVTSSLFPNKTGHNNKATNRTKHEIKAQQRVATKRSPTPTPEEQAPPEPPT